MSKNFTRPFTILIDVVGGSGSGVIPITDFQLEHIAIRPPAPLTQVYDWEVRSDDDFMMASETDAEGESARAFDFSMRIAAVINISNASADGIYAVKATFENLLG